MKGILKFMGVIVIIFSFSAVSFAELQPSELKPVDIKGATGSKADIFALTKDLSFGLKFNTFKISDNKGNYTVTANRGTEPITAYPPMFFVNYWMDGEDIAFNIFGGAGIVGGVMEAENTIGDTSLYMIELGADLNYIFMNRDRLYLSAGICENSFIGGVLMNQANRKSGNTAITNMLGLDARAKFYPFKELYLLGSMSFGFISLYSSHYYGYSVGNPAPDYSMGTYNVQSPFQFKIELTVGYRPSPEFAFIGGIGFSTLSFKSLYEDPVATYSNPSYVFSCFSPKFGISFLW